MFSDDTQQLPVPALSSDAPGQPLPLAESGEDKPKRRRRSRAEMRALREAEAKDSGAPAPSNEQQLKETAAALSLTFKALGAVVSAKRGEHWKLEQVECDSLGAAWAAVLAPYLERYGQAVPIVGALAITWGVVQSRVTEDQRRAAIRRSQNVAASDIAFSDAVHSVPDATGH